MKTHLSGQDAFVCRKGSEDGMWEGMIGGMSEQGWKLEVESYKGKSKEGGCAILMPDSV